jgi:hypothetical protein
VFADADGDGDVDQDDFGALQLCRTEPDAPIPDEEPLPGFHCDCFDVADPKGRMTHADYQAFEACASGPDVPADPACHIAP